MKKRVGMKRFFESENLFAVLFFFYLLVLPAFSAEYKVLSYSGNIGTMLLALSIVLIWGFCGIFSFGQAAMMGIGGYTYGIEHTSPPITLPSYTKIFAWIKPVFS